MHDYFCIMDLVLKGDWILQYQCTKCYILTTIYISSLFEEWHIQELDGQDNMSNVSEERSTRQQDIKKGLQFIEYAFCGLILVCLCI